MMNIKRLVLLLTVMGFAVGCTSTPEAEGEGELERRDWSPVATPGEDMQHEHDMAASGSRSYTVVHGDNLWDISAKESIYGNPYQWPLIYKANRDQIKDADLIYPGQQFSITRGMSGSEINSAVSHAKNRGAWTLGEVEASDQAY